MKFYGDPNFSENPDCPMDGKGSIHDTFVRRYLYLSFLPVPLSEERSFVLTSRFHTLRRNGKGNQFGSLRALEPRELHTIRDGHYHYQNYIR